MAKSDEDVTKQNEKESEKLDGGSLDTSPELSRSPSPDIGTIKLQKGEDDEIQKQIKLLREEKLKAKQMDVKVHVPPTIAIEQMVKNGWGPSFGTQDKSKQDTSTTQPLDNQNTTTQPPGYTK